MSTQTCGVPDRCICGRCNEPAAPTPPTSEELIAKARHQLRGDNHPSDTVVMRKETVRLLVSRLESAREALGVATIYLEDLAEHGASGDEKKNAARCRRTVEAVMTEDALRGSEEGE